MRAADRLASALIDTFLLAIRALPRRLVPLVAASLRTLARPFMGRELARLRLNVHRIYGLPPGTHFARMFERQTLRHQFVSVLESLQAIYDPRCIAVAGYEELAANVRAAEARGKPHIMLTAHLGSWELCAKFASSATTKPLHVLAKPSRSAAMSRVLETLRNRMGTRVLWTDRKTLLRDMLGALKRNEALGFVADQKPEGRQGPVVPFFGIPTAFVSGPASMALRGEATVVSVFCVREGAYRYRVLSDTVWSPDTSPVRDEQALTALLAAELERRIRAYPEQWTWSYKRWKWE